MKCFTKDEIEIVIKLLQTDLKLFKSLTDEELKNSSSVAWSSARKLILSLLEFEDEILCAFDYYSDKGLIIDERCILLKAKLEESE